MSNETTARSGGASEEGAAGRRPRRTRGPAAAVPAERAFVFSPRTLGAAIGLFAVGYLVLAFQMPDYTAVSVPVQPSTLPRWLGVVLLVLAVLLFFQRAPVREAPSETGSGTAESTAPGSETDSATGEGADSRPDQPETLEPAETPGPAGEAGTRLGRLNDSRLETGLFVGALCLYVALFEPLGFILSTALYLGSMTWYLGYRRHLATATVALGLPFALYAGMTWGLGVALPSGPLPF
ncbi:tripartite tricarboxylate transporter TctB family protein [Nocardiopsis exhalans]|uniref:Tripartite tricarboxylate transporter TctB family protein n=1 Tax=Nocardiopsis exhalans TaxID=163604 RepID=A0ABY5DDY3_9ACTN|nr:tripartite tricarboxylate transporter TctB family protein [Nocardiopsis exhalans]USY22549.1 tripartite tricarboxylate transporter TctB family protein [Nocardiopsis exhalans]